MSLGKFKEKLNKFLQIYDIFNTLVWFNEIYYNKLPNTLNFGQLLIIEMMREKLEVDEEKQDRTAHFEEHLKGFKAKLEEMKEEI